MAQADLQTLEKIGVAAANMYIQVPEFKQLLTTSMSLSEVTR
jgi:hypothetical protein